MTKKGLTFFILGFASVGAIASGYISGYLTASRLQDSLLQGIQTEALALRATSVTTSFGYFTATVTAVNTEIAAGGLRLAVPEATVTLDKGILLARAPQAQLPLALADKEQPLQVRDLEVRTDAPLLVAARTPPFTTVIKAAEATRKQGSMTATLTGIQAQIVQGNHSLFDTMALQGDMLTIEDEDAILQARTPAFTGRHEVREQEKRLGVDLTGKLGTITATLKGTSPAVNLSLASFEGDYAFSLSGDRQTNPWLMVKKMVASQNLMTGISFSAADFHTEKAAFLFSGLALGIPEGSASVGSIKMTTAVTPGGTALREENHVLTLDGVALAAAGKSFSCSSLSSALTLAYSLESLDRFLDLVDSARVDADPRATATALVELLSPLRYTLKTGIKALTLTQESGPPLLEMGALDLGMELDFADGTGLTLHPLVVAEIFNIPTATPDKTLPIGALSQESTLSIRGIDKAAAINALTWLFDKKTTENQDKTAFEETLVALLDKEPEIALSYRIAGDKGTTLVLNTKAKTWQNPLRLLAGVQNDDSGNNAGRLLEAMTILATMELSEYPALMEMFDQALGPGTGNQALTFLEPHVVKKERQLTFSIEAAKGKILINGREDNTLSLDELLMLFGPTFEPAEEEETAAKLAIIIEQLPEEFQPLLADIASRLTEDLNDVDTWTTLGDLCFDNDLTDYAIWAYEKALTLGPDNPDTLANLGIMYRDKGESAKALFNFDRAIVAEPRHEPSYFYKGVVLDEDFQDRKGAMQAWEKLAKINPRFLLPEGGTITEWVAKKKKEKKKT